LTTASTRDPRLDRLPPPQPPPEIAPEQLDPDSLKVVARLRRHGYEAYLVGGCVRDLLIGARPKDFDVVTSAHPEQVRRVFRNCRLIGRRFRLAHVFQPDGRFVEVATFRAMPVQATEEESSEETTDLLVTDDNQFGTAEEDARRRDFTVNGLLYDAVDGRTIDYVDGRRDLAARVIRTIGDPEIRLREDPVRGLRAARIAAKLGFSIDVETLAAMKRHADELPRCAAARVLDETLKLLRSGASAAAFRTLRETSLLRVLLPALDRLLTQGGAPMEERFWARLSSLDRQVAAGRETTDALLLALVLSLLPLSTRAESEDDEEPAAPVAPPPKGRGVSVEKVLANLSAGARLPRRVAERAVTLLVAQQQLAAPPRKRRRRGSGAGLANAPHFAESMQLLELLVEAGEEGAEHLSRWREKALQARQEQARRQAERAAAAEASPAQEPEAVEEEKPEVVAVDESPGETTGEAPKKKKRRRRKPRKAGEPAAESSEP